MSALLSFPFTAHAAPKMMCPVALAQVDKPRAQPGPRVADLVEAHAKSGEEIIKYEEYVFKGIGQNTGYNPSAPFKIKVGGVEKSVMLVRIEPKQNHDSEVWFFEPETEGSEVMIPIVGLPHLKMEDPFYVKFKNGESFFGGVQTFPKLDAHGNVMHTKDGYPMLGYRTNIFRDHGLGAEHFEKFFEGPMGMKDVRFAELEDGRVRVAGRPQNKNVRLGGRGKVSMMTISSIDDLTADALAQAPIIEGQVSQRDWIGVNQVLPLANGNVGYLSHIAYWKDKATLDRGYFVSLFSDYDLSPEAILRVDDLPGGLAKVIKDAIAKRLNLSDVLFANGVVRNPDGTMTLTVGFGDSKALRITLRDRFIRHEQMTAPNAKPKNN